MALRSSAGALLSSPGDARMLLRATIGGYLVGARLAAGGMGEVRIAFRSGIGQFRKPLALKLLFEGARHRAGFLTKKLTPEQEKAHVLAYLKACVPKFDSAAAERN